MIFTDSTNIFDVITGASYTTEKRLMIDVASIREAYNSYEISTVGLISGELNTADGLIRPNFSRLLNEIMKTGVDKTPVVQWVIRVGPKISSSLF